MKDQAVYLAECALFETESGLLASTFSVRGNADAASATDFKGLATIRGACTADEVADAVADAADRVNFCAPLNAAHGFLLGCAGEPSMPDGLDATSGRSVGGASS